MGEALDRAAIEKALGLMPDWLAPIREAVGRYADRPSIREADGTLCIGHRPWVAELNYLFRLYPGLESDSIERYADRFGIAIPASYAEFLRSLNGAFLFGISLFGCPGSMRGGFPMLDRSALPCHGLSTGVRAWSAEYRVPAEMFHFGSRHFSYSQNCGYFLGTDGKIRSFLKRRKLVGEWGDFTAFLADELRASEELEEKSRPSQWAD